MNIHGRLVAAAALALAACVSTSIRDSWVDPQHGGSAFRKFVVLGVSPDLTDRRIFEDAMAGRLVAAGVAAVQAYRYLPDAGKAPEPELDRAVQASGADALLMSRIISVDRRASVSTTMMPAGPAYGRMGWYGWYSGWYPVTQVQQYEVAVVETTLFDAASKRVVWTGVTETFSPRSVEQDAPGFADVVVKELAARGLLLAGK